MKKLFTLLCFVFIVSPLFAFAQSEIPFGVTPKEITITGSVVPTEDQINLVGFIRDTGKITDDYVYASGNRIGVKIGSVDYSLNFWNVGKLGGTTGSFFWKKDYSKAVLYLNYTVSENGFIIGDQQDNSKWGLPASWPMQPATGEPKINQGSCVMEFSGGPTGTFLGTCNDGTKITGRISAGNFIIFDKIMGSRKNSELGLFAITGTDLRLNGEFSDWKTDETGLVDSGTRFNSLSGQVEIRHDSEPNGWKSAQLDSILYVDDHIKTGEESEAILSLADMSTFVLKQETEIVLNAPPSKANKLKLVTGKVMANIKKMMKDGTMEIDMSQAVAGIKGTRFVLTETGTESKIEVTEGLVSFRSKSDSKESLVATGETVTAITTGLQEKTKFDQTIADTEILKLTPKTLQPGSGQALQQNSGQATSTGTVKYASVGIIALILGIIAGNFWKKRKISPKTTP